MTAEKDSRDLHRVTMMIQAIDDVFEDAAGGEPEFLKDHKTQRAVMLDLIHLVESASKVSPAFQARHPKVPWKELNRLRNHGLVHEYTEADLPAIWAFVRDELPALAGRLGRAKDRTER